MLTIPFAVAVCLVQSPASAVQAREAAGGPVPIVMDAEFDDWRSIPPVCVDPVDSPASPVDFGEVRVSHDDRFVYLLIDFGRTVNAQGLDGHAMILLNADGNPDSGRREHELNGVDLIIDLSPPNARSFDRTGVGMGIRSTTYTPDPIDAAARKLTVYDINLAFAPTHAGRRIEFRIDRGTQLPNTPALFEGERLIGKLVFVDVNGEVADETASFEHDLGERAKPRAAGEQVDDPLMRPLGSDLRVMTWNVQRGAIFTNPDPFLRTARAINPDVILFQELTGKNSAEQIAEFLGRAIPLPGDESWRVEFGLAGGDLRCAIATRHNLHQAPGLQMIPLPDRPDRTVRAVGAIVEYNERRVLVVSIHLRCCGRAGSHEDDQRVTEARALNSVIDAVRQVERVDGVVIAGDFNLVGSRDPLEIMAAGLDLDHSSLIAAPAYQIDGLSNATWSDPAQPFAPGRLDILLYSDSTMRLPRTFVYESSDLSPHWRDHYGVLERDSVEATDHRPIVADFR